MGEGEKVKRHEALHRVVTTHTSHTWAAVLVKMLLGQMGGQGTMRMTPYLPGGLLRERYKAAGKRLFLFDYDVSAFFLVWEEWGLMRVYVCVL